MTAKINNQIDVNAIMREARAARAALIRSFFSRIFSRRPKVPVSAPAQAG